jgi:3-oxoacyl-[acyl-carrier-protein] synthase-3
VDQPLRVEDESHMDKLYGLLDRVCTGEKTSDEIVRTSHVVGRLYAMQLEDIDSD